MDNCIFCSIAADPTKLIWENDSVAAFRDIHPDAPVHVLVVPKQHVARLSELENPGLAGELMMAVREVARQEGIGEQFRMVTNNGERAGQVVPHLHFHVMGNPDGTLVARRHQVGNA